MITLPGEAMGMAVTTFFGAVWWLVMLRFVKANLPRVAAVVAGTLVLTGMTVELWGRTSHHSGPASAVPPQPDWHTFNIVVNAEWVAILVTVIGLRLVKRPDLIVSVIALIVGLHFLPLAHVFGTWLYDLAGAGMMGGAAAGFHYRDADRRRAVTCAACGATLWLCASLIWWRA